jgi:DNA-binding IclR family transcriptional regulator
MVSIIESFTKVKSVWSLRDLSAHLGMPKPSLYRFLVSFEHYGILQRCDNESNWSLGYCLFIWGSHVPQVATLQQITRPFLRDLVSKTGETAVLTVYNNLEVICIDKIESKHTVRQELTVGERRVPYAGATSKIHMAYISEDEVNAIIQNGLRKFTDKTVTDPDELKAQLARIRREGYSFTCEERDPGVWGLAAPIQDDMGRVVAAIGLIGLAFRLEKDMIPHYIQLCRHMVKKIEEILCGTTQTRKPSILDDTSTLQ